MIEDRLSRDQVLLLCSRVSPITRNNPAKLAVEQC